MIFSQISDKNTFNHLKSVFRVREICIKKHFSEQFFLLLTNLRQKYFWSPQKYYCEIFAPLTFWHNSATKIDLTTLKILLATSKILLATSKKDLTTSQSFPFSSASETYLHIHSNTKIKFKYVLTLNKYFYYRKDDITKKINWFGGSYCFPKKNHVMVDIILTLKLILPSLFDVLVLFLFIMSRNSRKFNLSLPVKKTFDQLSKFFEKLFI